MREGIMNKAVPRRFKPEAEQEIFSLYEENINLFCFENKSEIPEVVDKILFDNDMTIEIDGANELDRNAPVNNKEGLAILVKNSLGKFEPEMKNDRELWNWLGLFLAHKIVSKRPQDLLKPRNDPDYYLFGRKLDGGRTRAHRHLVRQACLLHFYHDEKTLKKVGRTLQTGPHYFNSDFEESFNREQFLTNPNFLKLIDEMYGNARGEVDYTSRAVNKRRSSEDGGYEPFYKEIQKLMKMRDINTLELEVIKGIVSENFHFLF